MGRRVEFAAQVKVLSLGVLLYDVGPAAATLSILATRYNDYDRGPAEQVGFLLELTGIERLI